MQNSDLCVNARMQTVIRDVINHTLPVPFTLPASFNNPGYKGDMEKRFFGKDILWIQREVVGLKLSQAKQVNFKDLGQHPVQKNKSRKEKGDGG